MAPLGWFAALVAVAALTSATPTPQDVEVSKGGGSDIAAGFIKELIAGVSALSRPSVCKQSLTVDTGYAKYQGALNPTTGLNVWKGIRYAAPPTGSRRWLPPQQPAANASAPVTQATTFSPTCTQNFPSVPGLPFIPGDEDCLFLNVYAPPNAKNLPVLVWIHGGGYGYGDGRQDMSEIINDNGKNFIAVTIQYRLGAFGFLSSAEVKARGVANAGLLDQAFALAWVQKYICQFGGDASKVTIAGESAGAGSVMYHDIAIDGAFGTLLYQNGIAASPYLPFHYTYNAAFPTNNYYSFSQKVGCGSTGNVIDCLRTKDSMVLQQASSDTTFEQPYGYWAFYPVTDGAYITDRPSKKLAAKKLNGKRMLVGHNANEGPLFTPPNIVTVADLTAWLALEFPNLSAAQIDQVLAANPSTSGPSDARFETNGLTGGTAKDVSQGATGQQQRANNIYAEATFVCPSYWLSAAYNGNSKSSWHYQYSVPFAWHTSDVSAYFGPAAPNQGSEFTLAFRKIFGNLITNNSPAISNAIANGASAPNPSAANGASSWPMWTDTNPKQLNLNETGGTPYLFTTQWGSTVTQFQQPGLRNSISVVPADTWEGGRGSRCAFWNGLAPSIPA